MMSHEIIQKLKQEQELTSEEISYAIKEIVRLGDLELEQIEQSDLKKCNDAEKALLKLTFIFNLEYVDLSTKVLNNENLFHKFGLVVFNKDTHPISYLVDLTYEQFEKEEEYKENSPSKVLGDELSSKLIKQKYLPFTREIFENYIAAFEKSGNINDNRLLIDAFNKFKEFEFPIYYNTSDEYFVGDDQFSNGPKGVKL